MVADIGAVFGKKGKLTEESMIYCLFRHATAQVVRDLVTRMGERVVVQSASLRMAENVLQGVGIKARPPRRATRALATPARHRRPCRRRLRLLRH